MEQIVGSGKYTYDVNENWAHVPPGIEMKPAAVAVELAGPCVLLQSF